MGDHRKDVLVECASGHDNYIVERFRYIDGHWEGTRNQAVSIVEGERPAEPWTPDKAFGSEQVIRWRHELLCHLCGDKPPFRQERLDMILMLLSEHQVRSISLTALRARLEALHYRSSQGGRLYPSVADTPTTSQPDGA